MYYALLPYYTLLNGCECSLRVVNSFTVDLTMSELSQVPQSTNKLELDGEELRKNSDFISVMISSPFPM